MHRATEVSPGSLNTSVGDLTNYISDIISESSKLLCSEDDRLLHGQNPLEFFLVAYISLVLRMACIDLRTLIERTDNSGPPDLLSERYLEMCCTIMNRGCPFWKSLVDAEVDFKITTAALVKQFVQATDNGVTLLHNITNELLTRSPSAPKLLQKCFVPMQMMTRLMSLCHTIQNGTTRLDRQLRPIFEGLSSQAYHFFQAVDENFQNLISKQIPALTIDASQGLLSHLADLLRYIAASDERFAVNCLSEHSVQGHGLSADEREALVQYIWKFGIMKKCILEGRMEIRVQGVEVMQTDLVQIYTRYIQHSPNQKDHPMVQYLSHFMVINKLVEYLVGVDSHPQLIGRCGNIIGFLVITGNYTEVDSDNIWRAVTNSPDPRFVDAILSMLQTIFNISSYPILLYLTSKLDELPVHLFDSSMIRYSHVLLEHLQRTWRNDNGIEKMAIPPFNVCIRLLRQIAKDKSLDLMKRRDIHHFAVTEFQGLLMYGPSVPDRKAIYEECMRDVLDRTHHATGSIYVIDALLSQAYEKELSCLIQDWDVAKLIIEEFRHIIESRHTLNASRQFVEDEISIRLNLIQNLVVHVPDTLTASVGAQLWEYAVGPQALGQQAQQLGWLSLLRAIRTVNRRNSFIDRCIREYLPKLQPKLYTEGCLYFVQEVGKYQSRIAHAKPEDFVKLEPTAGDLLWQMSLAALPGTVESGAMDMLVTLYLDGPETHRRSMAETEAVHIDVVERCVCQLTSAASGLKANGDDKVNQEDGSMIVTANEEEIQAHKLSFSRSLNILREFVQGLRSRPKYSPQVHKQQNINIGSSDVSGGAIQIRYQPFGSGTSNDIRILEVESSEVMRDFISRLKSLTNFSKLTMISGGQKLDFNKILDQTVGALKLDQKGLLLVKQDLGGGESASNLSPSTGLRPVEVEIMTHFSQLYELLGMEEELAKQVCDQKSPVLNPFDNLPGL